MSEESKRVGEIFKALASGVTWMETQGLPVHCPADGEIIAHLALDDKQSLADKVNRAAAAQRVLGSQKREERAALVEKLSAEIKGSREWLGELITLEAGKTPKEALAEADGASDILLKTIKDASLAEFGGMLRCKERPPVGIVGLITSFNFPLVVANWTIAPALLAGNGVVWKPSEKTPLVALAYKAVFDGAMGGVKDLLQLVIGGREVGEALVSHEAIDMISATGSVQMGQGIKAALARKKNNNVKPILELGGNNGIIISEKMSADHLEWALHSLLNSFLGTTGQRCTNTRRLIVQRGMMDKVVAILQKHIEAFLASAEMQNPLFEIVRLRQGFGETSRHSAFSATADGYGPLIDADAYQRFERAKKRALEEGGKILFGERLLAAEHPNAYYVEPALAVMPAQTAVMHEETFAPLLFIAPYNTLDEAIALLNAPANAGLTNGIYTQSQAEADRFASANQAGHGLINSAKGTGTPAFGMGFGGNKESGTGEILNAADPLKPFTRDDHYRRIAQNKDIAMDWE